MHPTLKTVIDGQFVELPGTIATIRPTIPHHLVEDFDREVETAAADRLPALLARWALTAHPTADREDEDLFRRLEAGEDIGAVTTDDDARGAA